MSLADRNQPPPPVPPGRPPLILIIDDRDDLASFCRQSMGGDFRFHHVRSAPQAREFMAGTPGVDAVLMDRDFSYTSEAELLGPASDARNEGMRILRWLKTENPDLPTLMVTGFREQQTALAAADLGADFLAMQDLMEQPRLLHARLQRALEAGGSKPDGILGRFRGLGIICESASFARTLVALHQAISSRAPVLLLGETGSGKDTLAFSVHALSGDSSRPYVSVNVAALNPNLIESELFGHSRGAYTGAAQPSIGKLRYADGGTLFLNEIADLAPELQSKLLTALERDEVVPVGEVRSSPARFRLVTATSVDIFSRIESNGFRRDLFHRLAWHTIKIPPLRERRDDIPALVRLFLRESGQGLEGSVVGIVQEGIEYLRGLDWRGNIRELRAVIEAASTVARYMITLADVREVVRRYEGLCAKPGPRMADAATTASLPGEPETIPPRAQDPESAVFASRSYREVTARYFEYLLRVTGGRIPEVARRAGISKATAYEWKERFASPDPAPRLEE